MIMRVYYHCGDNGSVANVLLQQSFVVRDKMYVFLCRECARTVKTHI